ncbi:hypothetical protein [Rickettsia rhipicephali]|uniref:hypothetical protein n=1 Tax=Rickettsia rhipicephali TaxID=33992 RepID=UPI0022591A28|nr:hypothetical protein [Rickettsia rhipicephali]
MNRIAILLIILFQHTNLQDLYTDHKNYYSHEIYCHDALTTTSIKVSGKNSFKACCAFSIDILSRLANISSKINILGFKIIALMIPIFFL